LADELGIQMATNALKYAFPGGRNGTIRVELSVRLEQNIRPQVTDVGVGMPHDFDILKTKSLGLQLVSSLGAQLDGSMEFGNSNGTDFRVSFPF